MSAAQQERELRRALKERKRQHLNRRAYQSVYQRLAHLVPVVLPLVGKMHAYPIKGPVDSLLPELAPGTVLAFETALERWKGRRLLSARDLHAYTTDPDLAQSLPGLDPESIEASLTPIFPRPPHLFLWVVDRLPDSMALESERVVSADRLLREYLGTIGHRFDLLAVLVHSLQG